MNLVKVATGLYWLEIPEKNLSLMCGCPMDSIKHMMNKGIIHRVDRDDCYMETGPNMILLSDLSVQNGYFCNLAEFPILHMMYKQGLVLPGHPGNTGEKPHLIGTRDQVEAQKRYIFRGNYGLASREEFQNAGCSCEEVDFMWQLKMKFSFGKILAPEELVDTTELNGKAVELRPGVMLKRKKLNVYDLSYNDETVEIDLNLGKDETYDPPYELKPGRISRQYFSLIHVGEGNGWDNTRPCMGSIICYAGKLYLIDAGPNIESSLNALGIGVNDIEGIFHTHIHDDHFAGLTYLVLADHRIKYYATAAVMDTARKKLSALMGHDENIFNTILDPVVLDCHNWNDIDGLEVRPLFSPHPVETSIFYFRVMGNDGYKVYGHLADIVTSKVLTGFIAGEGKEGISREFYERVWKSYLRYADVKKVDVGGGMVHGDASDFRDDPSEKLILSHLDRPLNDDEQSIGTTVDFGSQDVLIPAKENYSLKKAAQLLASYIPDSDLSGMEKLLQCPLMEFNAGDIIVEDSTRSNEVFLIIFGAVKYIFSDTGIHHRMTAGSTVGLLNGLWDEPIKGTYEAAVHTEVLRIPKEMFQSFLVKNNSFKAVKDLSRTVLDLRNSALFGSRISNLRLIRLAWKAEIIRLEAGEVLPGGWPEDIYLLKKGSAHIYNGLEKIGKIEKWDSWGGYTSALFTGDARLEARASEKSACEFYRLYHEDFKDIPAAQWKLFQMRSCWCSHCGTA